MTNAAEFLHLLYENVPDGWLEITYIAPDGVRVYPHSLTHWRSLPLGTLDPALPKIHAMNARGYGCYFGVAVRAVRKHPEDRVNPKTGEKKRVEYPRGTQQDALYLTAFFVDADAKDYGGDMDATARQVERLNPTVMVESGGGIHGYLALDAPLLITDANRAEVKRTLKGMAKAVGADPHVAELARILRLPDTVNTKPEREGARCRVMSVTPVRHTYADLYLRYAPLIEVHTPAAPGMFDPASTSEITEALRCIPSASIPYDDWIRVLAALVSGVGAAEAETLADTWSGWCSQPGEIAHKIASFSDGTTATLGSLFYLAKQFGYTRSTVFPLTSANKQVIGRHIQGLQRGAS